MQQPSQTFTIVGGPYKDCRAQNNRIKPRGVLRNVTTCVTNSDDLKWKEKQINIQLERIVPRYVI